MLEGTFFWQVVDVEVMVKMTGDTTGDICNHARSKFIQLISKVTLKQFMESFNKLATQAHESDDEFYTKRGCTIHTLEVTAYRCQDASTARILEQIIQETTVRMPPRNQRPRPKRASAYKAATVAGCPLEVHGSCCRGLVQNRMNRLSKQESENEVKMFALAGEIEQETKRAELLKVLQQHKLMEAKNEGEAEAERVSSFLAATEAPVPSLDNRMSLWNVLRKRDALEAVSSGPARLYFTPNDVNLTIESREGADM